MTIRTSVLSIGTNRGAPRLWIEGRYLERAGFLPGRRVAARSEASRPGRSGRLVISVHPRGRKLISQSAKSGRYPVLDFNTQSLRRVFADVTTVEVRTRFGRITVTPARSERRKLARRCDGTCGSAFSGGGLLDEAARQAGYRSVFAIEENARYADVWQANHTGQVFQGCISQVEMRKLPQVDLLLVGVPCEPFSQARRQRGNSRRPAGELPEQHELADLSVWALLLVDAVNPRTVILEQVPGYLSSGIGTVTCRVLERMGYRVESRVINGTDYGALMVRRRVVIVAADRPIRWPEPSRRQRTLADVLLAPGHPECRWFNRRTKPWLFRHWERQRERGNGFVSQQLTPDTQAVEAITRRYFAGQGDNPVVKDIRPGRDGWFRWLTLAEVKRLMGLPDGYDLGPAQTTAGEILGQGVLVDVFRQVIESVAPAPGREFSGGPGGPGPAGSTRISLTPSRKEPLSIP